ncbi:MAG: molybdopterin-dependent oxidoreductase [Leptospirales bacterium]|nr:molybdopterin-dependent oxidoreductase [Leptospirales bacterium]
MKKIERKDFLALGGGVVLGGLSGWVFSGAPFLGFQWLVEWTQDQYVPVKGIEKYVDAVSDACPNGCSVSVRMLGNRAVKIESKKGVCPSCANALQLLSHPERIATPLKKTGNKGSGKFESISWEQAIKEISEKIDSLIKEGKGNLVAAINKNESLNSQLMERFIKAAGSKNVYYEPSLKSLTSNTIGGYINYDFERTDYILSFGAKLIEGWGQSVNMQNMFTQWKKRGTKIVQADTVCTMTASHATEWVPVNPGTEAVLAFGIANYLIKDKRLNSSGEEFGNWSQLIMNKFPLENVAKYTGVSVETIKKIGDDFSRAQNPVAVAGKGGIGVSASSAEIIAIYCLNTLVKSRAVTLMTNSGVSYKGEFAGLDDFIKNGAFEALFLNNSNPVYKSVLGDELKTKMSKAFVVSINPIMNDSANYADYILPSLSFLETETSVNKAVVKSFEESKDAKDIIIELSKAIDKTKNALPANGKDSYRTLARETASNARFSFNVEKIKGEIDAIEKKIADTEYPLTMIPVEIPLLGDGDGLAFPYVLKSIDPTVFYKGRLLAQINRETGKKYGLSENGSIVIKSARGKLGKVYVHLTDTVAPDTIAIPIGFGHEAYTKYGNKKGVNPKKIMAAEVDPLTGTADWWSTRVKIS